MKTLYLDCSMGAAGDMLAAALLELHKDPAAFVGTLNGVGIPGVEYVAERSDKNGITGTKLSVRVAGTEEDGRQAPPCGTPAGARAVVAALALPDEVKEDILSVYDLLAAAESKVHGVPVEDVHFHELGKLDAVADITAVCLLMRHLQPDEVVASPIAVGSGKIVCAHGTLPVPAPATAELLLGLPVTGGDTEGELCTPTGAALLHRFVTRFGPMPGMTLLAVGNGLGKRDYAHPNCLRAMLGESGGGRDAVTLLSCNVDDMTGEEIGFAVSRLFEAGARDVYTVAIGMKKNRPGTLIRVICSPEESEKMASLLFRFTTTLGVREVHADRYVLEREIVRRPDGVRVKRSAGRGVSREKIEYDDLAAFALEHDIGLREARELLEGS